MHRSVMKGDRLRRRSRISVAEQALFLHDNRLEMKKVILSVSRDEALPFLCRRRVIPELHDKSFFKGISLVGGIHGVDSNPAVNVAGEPLFESVHNSPVDKGTRHDLLDEDISGQGMEDLGTEFIPGVFHCSVDMPQHNIGLLIGLLNEHFLQI